MTRRVVRTPGDMGALPPVRRSRHPWSAPLAAFALAALVVITACAPVHSAPSPAPLPVPVGAPIPVPEKPVPIDPLADPWLVGVPRAPITHEIAVTTAVRAAPTPEALPSAHIDSSRTTLSVRWDSTSRASVRTGSLTAGWFTPPIAIVAELDAERQVVRVTTPRESSCGSDAAAAQMARELLLVPPSRLARGIAWVDSLRTTVCRDSIPLTLISTRRYVVEDARVQDGRAVVVIRRRSTTTLAGTGTQFGEPVTITGEGLGELLFGLRLEDGQMTEGNGVSSLTLSLTGRRKSQVVTQHARLEIRRAF